MKQKNEQGLRTFYILVLTQVLSMIGSRISGLAISIWVYQSTGDATPLSIVAFFMILPNVALAGIAGAIADRYDRRYVMAAADAGQAVGTILLLFSFLSGDFQLWHLYVVTFIQSLFGTLQGPAFMASVTMLVPDSERNRANAIQQMSGPLAGIIAPALAGVIYALVGITGSILIDMATFLLAVVVVLLVHIPRPEKTAEGSAMRGSILRESLMGFQFLWERRPLLVLLLLILLLNFALAGNGVLIPPYILSRTGSEATLGILLSVVNIGALAGGLAMGVFGGRFKKRIHVFMPSVILTGLFIALFGAAQTPFLMGLAIFGYMLPVSMGNTAMISMFQAKVPPDVQGRVFAVVGQLAMLVTPISYLMAGPLADTVFEPAVGQAGWEGIGAIVGTGPGSGIGLMFVIAGLVAAALTTLFYLIPSIRRLEDTLPDYAPVAAKPEEDPIQVPGDVVPA